MNRKRLFQRALAVFSAAALTLTSIPVSMVNSIAYTVTNGAVSSVVDEISDVHAAGSGNDYTGVMLHAWDWSFNQIKEEMPDIAAAGYTAVQTSPIQPNKDGSDVPNTGAWWKFYQPTDFTIGNKLGTKAEFQAMCEEAHKYGIKVIVDVVSNHLANVTGKGGNDASDRSPQIPSYLKDNNNYWHSDNYSGSSDSDRYQMTHAPIGMPDLNTANTDLQNIIIAFLNDAQDCGADGFRFDAAKHIETPTDTGFSSEFWSRIAAATRAKDPDVFLYGEILNTAGPGGYTDMQKYTPYIKVTNNKYGIELQNGVKNNDAGYAKFMNNDIFGSNGNEWVLWNESHDTFAGDYGEKTWQIDDEKMMLAWCAVAARYPAALYFARPTGNLDGDSSGGWRSSALGSHKMDYKNSRIVEMNKFHTAMDGEPEYVEVVDNVLVVERGTGGIALVNFSGGSKSISATMHTVADGTYTDKISGTTFTVSGKTLTGTIGSGGVAAIYNGEVNTDKASVGVSSTTGSDTFQSTLKVKLTSKNVTSASYETSEGARGSYQNGDTIIIGSSTQDGGSVTVTVTGTGTDGNAVNASKTFKKQKSVIDGSYDLYLKKPSGWGSTIYCYAYVDENTNNHAWPGVEMTSLGEDTYGYNLPSDMTNAKVIFNDNSNQVPGQNKPGFEYTKGTSMLYENGSLTEVVIEKEQGTVTVKYVDTNGTEIAASRNMSGDVGDSYTTSAATVSGYTLKTTPSNANGTYQSGTITVTYVYEAAASNEDPAVVAGKLADGATFDTETATVQYTLQNADSGTYCVDNGPVQSFTRQTDVVIGKGKIADTDVTVKVTATKGSKTTTKTFTYHKKFDAEKNGAYKEYGLANSGSAEAFDSAALAAPSSSYYATNPNGQMGKNKTITSASDFDDSMIIAQGVANDDPRIFRGSHEAPVYDTYALYGAWDDTNIYLGWQFTNVTDVVDPNQGYPISDNGKPWNGDIPQMLAFDLGTGKSKAGTLANGTMANGSYIWGLKVGFETRIDALMCFSSKPGVGEPALFKPGSDGYFNYDSGNVVGFSTGGISFKYEDGFFGSTIMGIKGNGYDGYTPDDLNSDSSAWVNFLNEGHNKTQDTFYYMTIPMSTLGVTKSYLESNGIGVMHISTFGEGGIASIPMDMTMLDNALEPYSQDESSSAEKEDSDTITVPLARLGAAGNGEGN
ncbi:MAG: starch-binding protein, partial [Lachnospiraceae bacterium]|nr:starch-binding protein [Lachnospiraceae bacterium]